MTIEVADIALLPRQPRTSGKILSTMEIVIHDFLLSVSYKNLRAKSVESRWALIGGDGPVQIYLGLGRQAVTLRKQCS